MPATIEQLADAIPRHLRYKDTSNPWGITAGTLEDYNQANGQAYGPIDLVIRGKEIAAWLLTKVRNVLAEAAGSPPSANSVVLGYLVGWAELIKAIKGEPAREPSKHWQRMAAAIVADAEGGKRPMHGSPGVTKAPAAPRQPSPAVSKLTSGLGRLDYKTIAWGVGSIIGFPVMLWLYRKRHK